MYTSTESAFSFEFSLSFLIFYLLQACHFIYLFYLFIYVCIYLFIYLFIFFGGGRILGVGGGWGNFSALGIFQSLKKLPEVTLLNVHTF